MIHRREERAPLHLQGEKRFGHMCLVPAYLMQTHGAVVDAITVFSDFLTKLQDRDIVQVRGGRLYDSFARYYILNLLF